MVLSHGLCFMVGESGFVVQGSFVRDCVLYFLGENGGEGS